MKKLLLSITLCATLLATGHQAQAQAEKHYGKICLISAFIAASCWAGGAYYSSQEAALAEQLDDLDPEELSELEAEISKFKTRKYVLWGAAGVSAVVAGVSGYKKFQNKDGETENPTPRETNTEIEKETSEKQEKTEPKPKTDAPKPNETVISEEQKKANRAKAERERADRASAKKKSDLEREIQSDLLELHQTACEIGTEKTAIRSVDRKINKFISINKQDLAEKQQALRSRYIETLENKNEIYAENKRQIDEKIAKYNRSDSQASFENQKKSFDHYFREAEDAMKD